MFLSKCDEFRKAGIFILIDYETNSSDAPNLYGKSQF